MKLFTRSLVFAVALLIMSAVLAVSVFAVGDESANAEPSVQAEVSEDSGEETPSPEVTFTSEIALKKLTDYQSIDVRFSYDVLLPEGAENISMLWNYGTDKNELKYELHALNNTHDENGVFHANAVFLGWPVEHYGTEIYVEAVVTYTVGGVTQTVKDTVHGFDILQVLDYYESTVVPQYIADGDSENALALTEYINAMRAANEAALA